jgi:hypothetical protein
MCPSFPISDKNARPLHTRILYPESADVQPDVKGVASFLKYCRRVKPAGEFADRSNFTPELLRPWIGYIMILDYIPETRDFRYRVYGTNISSESGFDVTNSLVSDFRNATGDFFLRVYREAIDKRALIYSVNSGLHSKFECDWHRIVCPVQHGDTAQIVACNYPTKRKDELDELHL